MGATRGPTGDWGAPVRAAPDPHNNILPNVLSLAGPQIKGIQTPDQHHIAQCSEAEASVRGGGALRGHGDAGFRPTGARMPHLYIWPRHATGGLHQFGASRVRYVGADSMP